MSDSNPGVLIFYIHNKIYNEEGEDKCPTN